MINQYKEILDYIREWELDKSLSETENLKTFVVGLQNKISELSTMPNSHHGIYEPVYYNDTIVTYCGKIEGKYYYNILKSVYNNQLGYYIMSHTEMGELLNLKESGGLLGALMERIKNDSVLKTCDATTKKDFIRRITGEKISTGERSNFIVAFDGTETELLTIFDFCSQRIIGDNAVGNALFIGSKEDENNVFALTELPTLLSSSKVNMIDGIETEYLNLITTDGAYTFLTDLSSEFFKSSDYKEIAKKLDELQQFKTATALNININTNQVNSNSLFDLFYSKRDINALMNDKTVTAKDFGQAFFDIYTATDNKAVKVYVDTNKDDIIAINEKDIKNIQQIFQHPKYRHYYWNYDIGNYIECKHKDEDSESAYVIVSKPNTDDKDNSGSNVIDFPEKKEEEEDFNVAAITLKGIEYITTAIVAYEIATYLWKYVKVHKGTDSPSLAKAACCAAFFAGTISAAEFIDEMSILCVDLEEILGPASVYAAEMKYEGLTEEELKEIGESYLEASTAQPPRDPLVIDLGATGIDLTSLDNGVHFDLDNNGFAEQTAWIGEEDGFLVLDRNSNGVIDNGGELFGDQVTLQNGELSKSGFEALSELDSNNDGKIDMDDEAFPQLKVWIDANHNGVSESNELKTLTELKIETIGLEYTETNVTDEETGTLIAETATVTFTDESGDGKKITAISEFWFPVDTMDTTQGSGDNLVVTIGNVPDIMQAIKDDETGELAHLYVQFSQTTDISEQRYYLKKILYFITGAEDVAIHSRGSNIDARDLKVVEQFMGAEFSGIGGKNPNTNAANMLKAVYANIENMYFNIINSKAEFGNYMTMLFIFSDEEGNKTIDMKLFDEMISGKIHDNEEVDFLIYGVGMYLKSYDKANKTNTFDVFEEYYSSYSKQFAHIINLSETGNTYLGTENSDSYYGTNNNDFIFGETGNDSLRGSYGNDYLYGGAGNDILYGENGNDTSFGGEGDDVLYGDIGDDILHGESGNDTLDGGTGNDILKGGEEEDTYVFAKGYGNDTIIDSGSLNTIKFTGLNPEDIRVNGTGENDVTITIKSTGDTLVIQDFRKSEEYRDYNLEFTSIKMHVTDPNSPFRHIYGGTGNDVLKAVVKDSIFHAFAGDDEVHGSDGEDIIYGNEGNDTVFAGSGKDFVFGGTGNDNLSGEEGDDILHAGEGDDILDGGSGNDVLDGGNGNDTYLFGKNYGTDTVNDSNGTTTVKLTDGLTLSDVNIFPAGEEVVICRKDTEDRLVLQNYAKNPAAFMMQTEEGTFAVSDLLSGNDGSVLVGTPNFNTISLKDEIHMAMGDESNDKITGNSGSDYLFGDSQSDTLTGNDGGDWIFGGNDIDKLYGNKGNDTLFGNKGKDELYGGEGDDCLDGGEEKDIMEGGSGNDTYFFRPGSGTDTILDQEGKNRILFGDGITKESLKAYRSGNNDLLLTFEGYQDTLILENYCIKEEARNLTLVFADGTVAEATDKDSPLRTIYGTAKSEYMKSFYSDGIVIKSGLSNDQLVGSEGDDILYGEDGNDRLTGNAGNDILDGGTGNDTLYGGAGDDTYIYKKGYGADTLRDEEGTSTIHIYDYNAGHVKAGRININDMALTFGDSGDKLIIDGFFSNEEARNFKLSFSGSSPVMATAPYSPLRTLYGTNGNDYMTAMDDNGVTLMGEKGVDHLNGGNGTDKLYGGEGNDHLHGHGGNDILDGGKGEDTLDGGDGNDTYLFHPGSGTDTIKDESGIHTILFGEGFSKENMTVTRKSQTDLQITFKDTKDKLVIQKYFTSKERRNISLQFADGSRFRYDDPDNPVKEIHAGNSNDRITAWDENGIILHGEGGNDKLNGAEGTDRLYGGTGNDKLYGHAGDDLLDGGTGSDTLNGGDGDDTYRFGTGYGSDIIEDNAGTGKVVFFDVASDAVTISRDKNANLLLTLKDTGDTLTIQDFETGNFTFEFADGVTGTIDSETAQWILTQPEETDPVQTGLTEEELIQANADLLSDLYTEDTLSEELFAQNDTSTLADTPDTVSLSEENKEVADQTDIQVMILTENMSAFGEEENVSAGIHISDISQETSNTNQLFVDSLAS